MLYFARRCEMRPDSDTDCDLLRPKVMLCCTSFGSKLQTVQGHPSTTWAPSCQWSKLRITLASWAVFCECKARPWESSSLKNWKATPVLSGQGKRFLGSLLYFARPALMNGSYGHLPVFFLQLCGQTWNHQLESESESVEKSQVSESK